MDIKKKVLFHFLFVAIITAGSSIFLNKAINVPTKSIEGVQTQVVSSTPTPTFSRSSTLTPTRTSQPLSTKIQPTSIKEYGGWYWRPDLNRAQVWIGTDSAGKDIWVDGIPTPTFTPTPEPKKSTQTSSGASSTGNTIQTLQTKITEKK